MEGGTLEVKRLARTSSSLLSSAQAAEVLCRLWNDIGAKLHIRLSISDGITDEVITRQGTYGHLNSSEWLPISGYIKKHDCTSQHEYISGTINDIECIREIQ